jgi:uncharacterized protein (TIGR02231 family)
MSTRVDAGIVAVTVYPGQARVTRRGTAGVDGGPQRVIIGGLPLGLRDDSVRVNGRGPATVLGVDVLAERHPRSPDVAVEELEKLQDSLRDRMVALTDEEAVSTAREELLGRLSRRSGATFAKALADDAAQVTRVAEVSDALAEQLGQVLAARRELGERRRSLQREQDEVARRLGDRMAQQVPDRRAVAVELEVADGGGELELELSYLVDNARWESRYDVRLRDESLTLTWFGLITQFSGEDWPECELRLSTARPASAVSVPELDPWFLDRQAPTPVYLSRSFGAAADSVMPAPAMAGPAEIAVATAAVEQGVAATTYQPARRIAVPSDGSAHRTTITVDELPARLDHVTVPLRGPDAYLRATVVNTTEHTLRPGPAAIFHETEYVGTTGLEPWAPGEEVELALGIDDRVRVERELIRRATGKALLGGTRRHEAAYKITVGNYGPRTASLTVIDQIPVSRDEAIVVREVKIDPKPAEQTELGEVTWTLSLTPNQTAELTIAFRVDVAKDVKLAGWRD